MPYISRDATGAISARFTCLQPGIAEEWLDDDHPDLMPQISAVKAKKREAINVERDRRMGNGGYKIGGKWFHSDQKSRSQQLDLVLLGDNISNGLQWKTMDGSFVTMTKELAQQIHVAKAASDQAIFSVAEIHKAALESSAEPESYNFSSGWPEQYE